MCDTFTKIFKKVFWCFREPDAIRTQSMQRMELDPDDKYIDIGNAMTSYKDAKYLYHFGLLWLLPISLILNALGNTDKLGRPSTESGRTAISVLVIVILILIIIICVSASIGYVYYNVTSSAPQAKLSKTVSISTSSIIGSIGVINDLFDIPTVNETYDLNRSYYGIILIIACIYTSFNILCTEIAWYLVDENVCDNKDALSLDIIGRCVVNQSNFAKVYVIIMAFVVIGTSYFEVSTNCKIRMEAIKNRILRLDVENNESMMQLRYNKVKEIEIGIQNRLKKWKESNSLNRRKVRIIASFVVVLIAQIGLIGIFRNSVFGNEVPTSSTLFCLWMYIGDAAMFTFCVASVESTLTHYSFPELIMNQLSKPIDCRSVGELISWWELRKCYLDIIIAIRASGITGILLAALSGNIICIILFLVWDKSDISLNAIFVVLIALVSFWTFRGVSSVVNFHNNQMNHAQMINKEKLKLLNDKNPLVQGIIQGIETDVQENSHPFSVLGVRLTSTFMIFLQSTFATIALAYIFA